MATTPLLFATDLTSHTLQLITSYAMDSQHLSIFSTVCCWVVLGAWVWLGNLSEWFFSAGVSKLYDNVAKRQHASGCASSVLIRAQSGLFGFHGLPPTDQPLSGPLSPD